jgi:dTDP-4-dehydrorhamnose reductase
MKILVLGANGNLGTSLIPKLKKNAAYEVISFTRNECNVLDKKDLTEKITELKPDVIINTVAYNKVDACELDLKEQHLAIDLNLNLPKNLAEIARNINAKLIHFSTNYVFSGEEASYDEESKPDPVNFYGLSKLLGEEAVLAEMSLGLKAAVVRVSNIYGVKGTGISSKPNFFETMLKVSKDREEVTVVDDELCTFTYLDDISDNLIKYLEKEDFEGVFHFVNTGVASWYEACRLFFSYMGVSTRVLPISGDEFKRPAKRPHSACMVATKTVPMRDYKEALKEYAESLK